MVLPLPDALSSFSLIATQAINALSAIQATISNPMAVVQSNVVSAATDSVTSGARDLFNQASDAVGSQVDSFVSDVTAPPSLNVSTQQQAAANLFGTDQSSGSLVDSFVSDNVKLGSILPAQQLYNLTQGLANLSIYADPLQVYNQVTAGLSNLVNLCKQTLLNISTLISSLSNLLTLQATINYSQYLNMGKSFYTGAITKVNSALSKLTTLCSQLSVNGKFNPVDVASMCGLLDDFSVHLTFGNTNPLQYNTLQQAIQSAITAIRKLARDLMAAFNATLNFVPKYQASVSIGPLFQAVQGQICAQAQKVLQGALSNVTSLSTTSVDDNSKFSTSFEMAAQAQAVKSFICQLQPSISVTDPLGPFATLSASYNVMGAAFKAADPTHLFQSLENTADSLAALMNTGVVKNNSIELTAGITAMIALLTSIQTALNAIVSASGTFTTTFVAQTSADPSRLVGGLDVFDNIGADNSRNQSILNNGDATGVDISQATTDGQLAQAIKSVIGTLPDGNDKDQMTLLYNQVVANHQSTVLAMDFSRRESVSTFVEPDQQQQFLALVQKTSKTFSGIPKSEFDPVTTVSNV